MRYTVIFQSPRLYILADCGCLKKRAISSLLLSRLLVEAPAKVQVAPLIYIKAKPDEEYLHVPT